MSPLNLVRLAVDVRALVAFAVAEGVDDDDRGYAVHLALRRRFGAAAPQPFRLFDTADQPHLLGYAADERTLTEAGGLPALDERLSTIFPSAPAIKPMPSDWRSGARYAFEVRVRPVVRFGPRLRALRAGEGKSAAGERDAFLAAIEKADGGVVDREAVYRDWLLRQVREAAAVERADLRLMRRLRTRRSSHGGPGARRIEGYEVLFGGTLSVDAPEAFARLLAHGVGRHAAFGFGMLMLAPPGRR